VGGLLFKDDTDQDLRLRCCLANLCPRRVQEEHWAHEEHRELQEQDPPMLLGNIYIL